MTFRLYVFIRDILWCGEENSHPPGPQVADREWRLDIEVSCEYEISSPGRNSRVALRQGIVTDSRSARDKGKQNHKVMVSLEKHSDFLVCKRKAHTMVQHITQRYRIDRRTGYQGLRPSVISQAGIETYATGCDSLSLSSTASGTRNQILTVNNNTEKRMETTEIKSKAMVTITT